jgi:hypothetical protein
MRHPNEIFTPDKTFLDLNQPHIFGPFFAGYLELLREKLSQVDVISTSGQKYSYITCGQDHHRRNPNWKPWRYLEWYCDKMKYDFFEARDMIFSRIGRKLDCECEFLRNDDEIRRRRLETFGVDFGEPGNRDFDIF